MNCSFVDCTFNSCNLSLIKTSQSTFVNIEFIDCKIIGINWEKIKGNMGISLSFENSTLNYSSFVDISFLKSKIKNCEVVEVNFFNTNLAKCDLRRSNFQGTIFSGTNLQEADFREATNYSINILENPKNLKGAKFSSIEVESLLNILEIVIE